MVASVPDKYRRDPHGLSAFKWELSTHGARNPALAQAWQRAIISYAPWRSGCCNHNSPPILASCEPFPPQTLRHGFWALVPHFYRLSKDAGLVV